MKKTLAVFVYIVLFKLCNGQQRIIDSLKQKLPASSDTLELVLFQQLNEAYGPVNKDSSINYAKRYLTLSQKLKYEINYADALRLLAISSEPISANELGLLLRAEQILVENTERKILPARYLEMMQVPKSLHSYQKYSRYTTGKVFNGFTIIYWHNRKYNQAYPYAFKALEIANELQSPDLLVWSNFFLGVLSQHSDSCLMYFKNSRETSLRTGYDKALGIICDFTAKEYAVRKDYTQQLYYLRESLQHYNQQEMTVSTGWGYLGLGEYYLRSVPIKDSALFYVRRAFQTAVNTNNSSIKYWASKDLYDIYKASGYNDSAFTYVELMLEARERVYSEDISQEFDEADYNQQIQRTAIEKANEKLRNKVRLYSFLAGLAILLLLTILFWRNGQRRKKAFIVLQTQKAKTEQALQELKSAQQQLIQSEKMASLGELTAGIAHEIQNPLNFVNNFSEVNTELIDELEQKIDMGNLDDAKTIAKDIKENEQKINHHGKRADAIVKGMLQHSRSSSRVKESTDINKLADEYLRLAFHGFREKDKLFNATMKKDFDESIGKVNIIAQDIGRTILNLITNAFYTVAEKKRQQPDGYEPTVSVSTKKSDGKVEVLVNDNGNGIPQKILDKIFQPFFTTKPTGEGTGLGLSLSYDIIKAHNGELKVETREGEGATFIIILPQ